MISDDADEYVFLFSVCTSGTSMGSMVMEFEPVYCYTLARCLCLSGSHHDRALLLFIPSARVLLLSSDIVRLVTGMTGRCASIPRPDIPWRVV